MVGTCVNVGIFLHTETIVIVDTLRAPEDETVIETWRDNLTPHNRTENRNYQNQCFHAVKMAYQTRRLLADVNGGKGNCSDPANPSGGFGIKY